MADPVSGDSAGMDDTAQDAAEALIALGWPVLPHGPDMDQWQIGDLIWTDDELMGLAARQGFVPAGDRLQLATARQWTEPKPRETLTP